jgi:hypothetical protein
MEVSGKKAAIIHVKTLLGPCKMKFILRAALLKIVLSVPDVALKTWHARYCVSRPPL